MIYYQKKDAFNTTPQQGLLLMKYNGVSEFKMDLQATFEDQFEEIISIDQKNTSERSISFIEAFSGHLSLRHLEKQDDLNIFNAYALLVYS